MRFNKKKFSHWLTLLASSVLALIGALLRRSGIIKRTNLVVFYGHVLNGNLKAFYDYLETEGTFQPAYVTMFPEYRRILQQEGARTLFSSSLKQALQIVSASAVVTDHGAHFLFPAYRHTNIGFFDVWHGIPYKGFDKDNFSEIRSYNEVWVSSQEFVSIYRQKYQFTNPIIATGYGRTDPLVNDQYDKAKLIKKYRLSDRHKHIILVAPTWKQDSKNRSIIPFGETLAGFFSNLDQIGKSTDSLVIFRAHLNSGDTINMKRFPNVVVMPYAKYPIAEEFLGAADLVVSDWSSIVFDFMVLKRPTVYLDVPAPFEKGFTLDGSYRFGPVVKNMAELKQQIIKYIGQEKEYQQDFKAVLTKTERVAYGSLADGRACERYAERLKKYLSSLNDKK